MQFPSACMPDCMSRLFSNVNRASFVTSIERTAHTQRDSPGDSTRRGHHTIPPEYNEDRVTDIVITRATLCWLGRCYYPVFVCLSVRQTQAVF